MKYNILNKILFKTIILKHLFWSHTNISRIKNFYTKHNKFCNNLN